MNDEPPNSAETRRPSLTWALWMAFILLVVYPLSTGPVARFTEVVNIRPAPLLTFYAPVAWVADRSPVLQRFFKWYIFEVWEFHPFGSGR
jgi:hypothetical protein